MNYLIILEKTGTGYGAHAPDLPGCVAAAETYDETVKLMREAIAFHIEVMREHGEIIPAPTSMAETVTV